jgi:hypothetical protein
VLTEFLDKLTLGVIYRDIIMELDFDNIIKFSLPLDTDTINQFFVDEDGKMPAKEHEDQIFVFKNEASKFLWDFEHKVSRLESNPKFYKTITSFNSDGKSMSEIKKYLYNLGIPFSNWVFIAEQPNLGFMLTWKMVIKYCSGLFFDDYQQIWDKTLNWKLEYNHGQFTYGKDLIFNSDNEADKISHSLSEMTKRKHI